MLSARAKHTVPRIMRRGGLSLHYQRPRRSPRTQCQDSLLLLASWKAAATATNRTETTTMTSRLPQVSLPGRQSATAKDHARRRWSLKMTLMGDPTRSGTRWTLYSRASWARMGCRCRRLSGGASTKMCWTRMSTGMPLYAGGRKGSGGGAAKRVHVCVSVVCKL